MKTTTCCRGDCSQGRSCPLSTVRIHTRRSLIARLWDLMEVSWWPASIIYAIGAVVIIVAKWNQL